MPFTNNSPISPYPLGPPTIAGQEITSSVFLQTPARVQRAITDFTVERFIMDKIFSVGPQATGGAVVYDQVLGTFFFLDRDVQEIRPGAQFPILAGGEQLPQVAAVRKLGGEVMLTYEAVRRDNRNLVARGLRRLGNNIVRYVDGAAVASLNAAPINTLAAAATWTTSSADPIQDIAAAAQVVYGPDLGYVPDTMLLNPFDHASLVKNPQMRTSLPRENLASTNPVFGGYLNMIEGLSIYKSNRVAKGTCYILESRTVGSWSDEVHMYARPIDEPREEAWYIHGARIGVPYVTDPLSCVKLTGIS